MRDGFDIYPALDIRGGSLARSPESEFQSIDDALHAFEVPGIQWLHLVDLDFTYGEGSNAGILKEIISKTVLNIQVSGGIQDAKAFDYVCQFNPQRINLAPDFLLRKDELVDALNSTEYETSFAIDLSDNIVTSRATGRIFGEVSEVIHWLSGNGCKRIVLTEVAKDGRLQGVNYELYRSVCDQTDIPIVASGGVSSIADIVELKDIGVVGAIVGAALHHGNFTLSEALNALENV